MKGHHIFIVSGLMLLLTFQTGWASDQFTAREDVPAIMASLDPTGVTALDDTSIACIRGQAYSTSYVLVKVLGLNTFDPNVA